jgi:ABC-type multidrug transport system fused ATPase/permease subunit
MVKGNSVVVTSLVAMLVILSLYGKHSITVGDVALFIAYFNSAANSIWELSWQLDMYYRSFGTIDNALKGLSKGENEDTVAEDELDLPNKAIAFNNVGFYYPDQADKKVLHNINLNVAEGERVGLVGHSGAGKTTLVGLLLGFYRPTSGDFSIGGLPVERLGAHRLRDITAFVPQDTNLFNRTIAQNIGYAKPGATREEIMRAAKDAQADDFIQNLPKGYDTIIGERGVKLSGGQRQRIAIARALLKDSPILVLDEATSALDSVSEQAIQKAFVNAMKNRTALVVAHRLSTLRHLDRIIVFDGGTIVEQGTHDELVAKQGLYADLWRRQKDGFIGD